jgi:hypothetical protein
MVAKYNSSSHLSHSKLENKFVGKKESAQIPSWEHGPILADRTNRIIRSIFADPVNHIGPYFVFCLSSHIYTITLYFLISSCY